MRDLDGDGRDEVIALCPSASQLLPNASLGALSYFDYGAMSSGWSTAAAPQLIPTAVLSNQFPPGLVLPSSFLQAAIRAPGQADLLQFDGVTPAITFFSWGWGRESGQAPGLRPLWVSQKGVVPGGPGMPPLSLSNCYNFVGDFDGDGLDEIFVLSPQPALFALMKWNATSSTLEAVLQQTPSIVEGSAMMRQQWRVGDFDGDGRDELLAYDAVDLRLFVMKYVENELTFVSLQADSIPFEIGGARWDLTADSSFFVADVDGDGVDELVAFHQITGAVEISVLRWDPKAPGFVVKGTNVNNVYWNDNRSQIGWVLTPSVAEGLCVAHFEQSDRASVLLHQWIASPFLGYGNIATLRWSADDRTFYVDYSNARTNFQISNSAGQKWTFSDDTYFSFADVDGDGVKEIIVQSDSSLGLGLIKWGSSAGGANGGLNLQWSYYPNSAAGQTQLEGWGVNTIASAPFTGYTQFLGAQSTIYGQTSQQLSQNLSVQTSDIRQLYSNLNLINSFADLASQVRRAINDVQKEPPIYDFGFDDTNGVQDLLAVWSALFGELSGLNLLYAFRGNVDDFLQRSQAQQLADRDAVVGKFNNTPPSTTPVEYWLGQVFDAALWGIAAAPLGPEAQVGFAVLASLMGSLMNAGGNNATAAVSYINLSNTIENAFISASTQVDALILGSNGTTPPVIGLNSDSQKLSFLSTLLARAWAWDNQAFDEAIAASSRFNRYSFYQILMPTQYQIYKFANWTSYEPYFYVFYPSLGITQKFPIYPPGYASWTFNHPPPGICDIYVLCAAGSTYGNMTYPQQPLTDDLFGSPSNNGVGASLGNFLNNLAGWTVPVLAGGNAN